MDKLLHRLSTSLKILIFDEIYECIKKFIQSMYHTNDFQIPRLAAKFFREFILKYSPEHIAVIKEQCEQIQTDFSMWDKINAIIAQIDMLPQTSICSG